jgi:hypothetical protein
VLKEVVSIDLQQGVKDYPIELEGELEVLAVHEVKIGSCCLTPDRSGLCSGCGCHSFKVDGGTLFLPEPTEDVECGAMVVVHVKPTQTACTIPDRLYNDWAEAIVDGGASRCMMIPKTDWFNPQLATYYERRFSAKATAAKNQRAMGGVTSALMMKGARF